MSNPFEVIDTRLEAIETSLKVLADRKPEPKKPTEKYLTVDEVCELFSVSRVTLWNWDRKGIITPVRIGSLKRYKLSEIENVGKDS